MASKLYVGGLSYSTTSESLRQYFAQCGTVESATVITDRMSGDSRGFGRDVVLRRANALEQDEFLARQGAGGVARASYCSRSARISRRTWRRIRWARR